MSGIFKGKKDADEAELAAQKLITNQTSQDNISLPSQRPNSFYKTPATTPANKNKGNIIEKIVGSFEWLWGLLIIIIILIVGIFVSRRK